MRGQTNQISRGNRTGKAGVRGAIYARYSSRFQHSIDDQVRECREWAERQGIEIKQVFTDEAKSGRSSQRQGLKALRQALEQDEVDVVIIFTTNRLYRKMYQSLMFVEEEIVDRNKRCVFVRSGIDTGDSDDWRQRLQLHALIDEFLVQTIAKHVHAAHEGLLLQTRVFGTITFGYAGEEIAGQTTRQGRPARRLIIDSSTSVWVKKIFDWFTRDRCSLVEIVRRLNEAGAPLPPRSSSERWTRLAVRRVLTNARYIGDWAYGATRMTWLNKQSYGRQLPRETPLREVSLDELRIIDDVTWARAQERLHSLREQAGRHPRDGDRRTRPRVLNGLLYCSGHQQRLYVGGSHGKYMFCRSCQESARRFLHSQLHRQRALELICQRLAAMIQQDQALADLCVAACRQQVEELQRPDPARLQELQRRLSRLTAHIQFVLQAPGETAEDQAENQQRLVSLRQERATLQREIAEQEQLAATPLNIPGVEEVQELLVQFAMTLQQAAESDDPGVLSTAREIIQRVTGGRIQVSQCGEPGAKRGWLRVRFPVNLICLTGLTQDANDQDASPELEIDILPPDQADQNALRVKELVDSGLLLKDIATQLGWHRNRVTRLLRQWYETRGMTPPDGRSRRKSIPHKQGQTPLYQQVADQVQALWTQGVADTEIARRLGCSDTTARKAFVWWHTSRNLPVPGQQDRRQQILEQVMQRYEQRVPLRQIAAEVGLSTASVRNLLREGHAALGLPLPDGRTRRALPAEGTSAKPESSGVC